MGFYLNYFVCLLIRYNVIIIVKYRSPIVERLKIEINLWNQLIICVPFYFPVLSCAFQDHLCLFPASQSDVRIAVAVRFLFRMLQSSRLCHPHITAASPCFGFGSRHCWHRSRITAMTALCISFSRREWG